jgi:hypothetical protein
MSRTFRLPDITDWWHQPEETCSKYTNFSNVAPDILSSIPDGIGVQARVAPMREIIESM